MLRSPAVTCDSPTGVGCTGNTILRAGRYRLDRVYSDRGICHVSGTGGSGWIQCRSLGPNLPTATSVWTR